MLGCPLSRQIRGDFELRPNEHNKLSKHSHHHFSLAGTIKYINHFKMFEYLLRTREIVMAFSDYTARLCKIIRFRYYAPREINAFMKTDQTKETE